MKPIMPASKLKYMNHSELQFQFFIFAKVTFFSSDGKKKSLLYGYIFTVPLRRRRRGTDECKYKGKLYLPRSEDETFIRKRMKVILSDCGKRLRRNRTYILYAALKPNELGDYLQIESDNILTVTKKLAPKLTKFWRSSK